MPHIYIITGEPDEGKTSFLKDLWKFISISGIDSAGFICPGEMNCNNEKNYLISILPSGPELPFASRTPVKNWIHLKNFWFNPLALEKGESALNSSLSKPADLIIIDEVGPFELQGYIWDKTLKVILHSFNGVLILSTRNYLFDKLISHYQLINYSRAGLNTHQPGHIAREILQLTGKHLPFKAGKHTEQKQ